MARLKRLLEPIKIGAMEVKNRMCMGEIGPQGDEEGNPAEATVGFYVERAKGGAGLIMVGGTYPDPTGRTSKLGTALYDDRVIPAYARMTRLMHEAAPEVKIGVQFLHCGRQMHVFAEGAAKVTPIAPSPVPYRFGVVPHEMTIGEIEYQINQYAEAARRAREAGFDCVGLHGAHGYLISQFISPYTNRRTDRYGGSIENRARFGGEIIQAIKRKCGQDFPVLIKINYHDYLKDVEEQITLEHTKAIVPFLEKAGADEITISSTTHESSEPLSISPYMVPMGPLVDAAGEIKKIATVPIGAINKINEPVFAEKVLEDGKADLIFMSRPLLADAEFPRKVSENRVDEIRNCIACCTCIDMLWDGWNREVRCAINPEAYRERSMNFLPSRRTKNVLVIGGGPAGAEAARVAAQSGHQVTLWEKEDKLGGQVNLAALTPDKYDDYMRLIRYYSVQLKKLGVKVELNKEATPDLVREACPGVVILAAGAVPFSPPIPGVDRSNVFTANDVVAGKVQTGDKVVVIGGGMVGLETAQLLARNGKKVTIVEILPQVGTGMVRMVYLVIRNELRKAGVEILRSAITEEITAEGVSVTDWDKNKRFIEADTVVLACGTKPNRGLLDRISNIVPEVYMVGDCLRPRNIMAAIYQGAMAGRSLDDYQPKHE